MMGDFPDLGVGVGLRTPHFARFQRSVPSSIHWVEVISENYMSWNGESLGPPCKTLNKVRENVPVCLHGVSLSIGSTDPINLKYLAALQELIKQIEPAWVSDHLCWTSVDGQNLHDLMPMPYTEEALNWIAKRILQTQERLGRRLLIENVSHYLQYESSELTEWEFLSEVSKRADCGILLDINNVYVNSVNQNFDPLKYLHGIPWERVGQIHLAGHTDMGEYLIDTHDAPICPEVWNLYCYVTQHLGRVSTMIERDANIPAWEELETELNQIHLIRESCPIRQIQEDSSAKSPLLAKAV
jgi:uncharacterized protein (UPF0276 family)